MYNIEKQIIINIIDANQRANNTNKHKHNTEK